MAGPSGGSIPNEELSSREICGVEDCTAAAFGSPHGVLEDPDRGPEEEPSGLADDTGNTPGNEPSGLTVEAGNTPADEPSGLSRAPPSGWGHASSPEADGREPSDGSEDNAAAEADAGLGKSSSG